MVCLDYYVSHFRYWSNAANILFVITVIFYFIACCMEPGLVLPEYDIIVTYPQITPNQ